MQVQDILKGIGVKPFHEAGNIHLISEKGRCVTYRRPVDGSRDVSLCAMDLHAYNDHPHLREMFTELAAEVALNRRRQRGDSVTLRVREPLSGSTARWVCPA